MKKTLVSLLLFINIFLLFAQETVEVDYTFPLYDGINEYMTMRQMDRLYQSTYTIIGSQVYEDYNLYCTFGLYTLSIFVGSPITHEEAHRSILTSRGIGSLSQPIYNTSGSAYVKGVSDITLKNLRDSDLPVFIRLHTAGIESDYMNMQQAHRTLIFNPSLMNYVSLIEHPIFTPTSMEFVFRLTNVTFYLFSSVRDNRRSGSGVSTSTSGLVEESNEL